MATTYSNQKQKWDQNSPKEMIKPNEMYGRMRVAFADVTMAGLAVGPVEMFNLPNGARILEGTLVHTAMGGSTTISVGHAAYTDSSGATVALDVDEYKAAAASTGIADVGIAETAALGRNSIVDADETGLPVTLVLAGGAGTGTASVTMYWVLD